MLYLYDFNLNEQFLKHVRKETWGTRGIFYNDISLKHAMNLRHMLQIFSFEIGLAFGTIV